MTTQSAVTQGQKNAATGAASEDAAKLRRVLSVREPAKNQDKAAPPTTAKSSAR